jgi:hypothetical protein
VTDHCAECGFTYDLTQSPPSPHAIQDRIAEVATLLRDPTIDTRPRRDPDVWSPLEYACHLRDLLLVQRERVLSARRTDCPDATPMGRNERVDHDGYATQNPTDVARQLTDAALMLANTFTRLTPTDWTRTVLYHYPNTSKRSLHWLALHTLHEAHHHLLDIRRQLA